MNINLEKVGYLYTIDKNDYDLVYWVTKNRKSKDDVKNFILDKYKEYGITISVSEFEIYVSSEDLKDFLREGCFIGYEVEGWPCFYELDSTIDKDKVFNNSFVKELDSYSLVMPTKEFNKMEKLMQEWMDYSDIFVWNGRQAMVDTDNLKKVKELITKIEEEIERGK